MIGDEASPGRLVRFLDRLPDGFFLRFVFMAMLGLSAFTVITDYRERAGAAGNAERLTRTEPMPLTRPRPGDQIRPYLPKTIPVGPDRGEPVLPGFDGPLDGSAMADPMRFVSAGSGVVSAVGTIQPGTAVEFQRFLDENDPADNAMISPQADDNEQPAAQGVEKRPRLREPIRKLYLHSPGGSVDDAIEMARLVRERRISTFVPADGYCASACPLLLAGGLTRHAGTGAWVGVHQVYAVPTTASISLTPDVDRSIADIQETIARCQELLAQMGVDPAVWIKAMQTPADSLYVLTGGELVSYRLVRPLPDDASFVGPPAPLRPVRRKSAGAEASVTAGPGRASEPAVDAWDG